MPAGLIRKPGIYSVRRPDAWYTPLQRLSLIHILENHPNVVVAVSEGIRLADGKYVGESAQSGVKDVFGHQYLAGTGKALELAVKKEIGCKVRSVELNLLQRCASHCASKTDLEEAVRIGRDAVRCAVNGASGKMMCFQRESKPGYAVSTFCGNISDIANRVPQALEALKTIRPEVDSVLLELWNQIEENFKNEPPEVRFAECRKYGPLVFLLISNPFPSSVTSMERFLFSSANFTCIRAELAYFTALLTAS